MNELALFAGAGGGILGGHLLGWRTVCAVEWEPYPASILCARQNDGILPPFPVWDDVRTFDGRPWRGIVDVVSGGFPCQDISAAGKGAGIEGERSGMWKEMARIIGEVRPTYVFVENSPMLTSRGLGTVLADLAALGFDAEWGVLSAADVGAPHLRERIWIVAYTQSISRGSGLCQDSQIGNRIEPSNDSYKIPDPIIHGRNARRGDNGEHDGAIADAGGELDPSQHPDPLGERPQGQFEGWAAARPVDGPSYGSDSGWWATEPDVGRVAHGVAARVDRLKAIGNGQVPLCASTAFTLLRGRLEE